MKIGLLGLQGAFRDHIPHLQRCGVQPIVVRTEEKLAAVDRLILPGGESTVMAKFIREFGLLAPLRKRLAAGMPTWGICAGAILLAEWVDGTPGLLQALPIRVTRNAYGRQRESRLHPVRVPLFGENDYPAIFIRSPRIDNMNDDVAVHACDAATPVFIQYGRVMATTFHPELNGDNKFHRYFLSI